MKKLVIVAVAVLCGAFAQASTVAWNMANVTGPDGELLTAGHAYVFFVQGNEKADTSSWATLAEKGKDALISAVAGANMDYTKAQASKADAGAFSQAAMALSDVDLAYSTKYSVYAVIFDTDTITDASHFYVTDATAAQTTFTETSALTKTYTIGTTPSATASNWKAVGSSGPVPEPTSGLLLVLGMAGLALRRKRA